MRAALWALSFLVLALAAPTGAEKFCVERCGDMGGPDVPWHVICPDGPGQPCPVGVSPNPGGGPLSEGSSVPIADLTGSDPRPSATVATHGPGQPTAETVHPSPSASPTSADGLPPEPRSRIDDDGLEDSQLEALLLPPKDRTPGGEGCGSSECDAQRPSAPIARVAAIQVEAPELPAAAVVAMVGTGLLGLAVAVLAHVWGLFSRLEPSRLLVHPLRARIHAAIAHNPGIHRAALERTVGTDASTLRHHLRKLTKAGLVVAMPASGYICHFIAGAVDRRLMPAAGTLRAAGARAVFAAVRSGSAKDVKAVAAAARMAPSTAHYHLQRMEAAGLVAVERTPRSHTVQATPAGHAAADLGSAG